MLQAIHLSHPSVVLKCKSLSNKVTSFLNILLVCSWKACFLFSDLPSSLAWPKLCSCKRDMKFNKYHDTNTYNFIYLPTKNYKPENFIVVYLLFICNDNLYKLNNLRSFRISPTAKGVHKLCICYADYKTIPL